MSAAAGVKERAVVAACVAAARSKGAGVACTSASEVNWGAGEAASGGGDTAACFIDEALLEVGILSALLLVLCFARFLTCSRSLVCVLLSVADARNDEEVLRGDGARGERALSLVTLCPISSTAGERRRGERGRAPLNLDGERDERRRSDAKERRECEQKKRKKRSNAQ